jgi:hypothetical protein
VADDLGWRLSEPFAKALADPEMFLVLVKARNPHRHSVRNYSEFRVTLGQIVPYLLEACFESIPLRVGFVALRLSRLK